MWETWARSLGWDDPLEKGKATHSSVWPGESMGSRGVGHDWVTFTFIPLRNIALNLFIPSWGVCVCVCVCVCVHVCVWSSILQILTWEPNFRCYSILAPVVFLLQVVNSSQFMISLLNIFRFPFGTLPVSAIQHLYALSGLFLLGHVLSDYPLFVYWVSPLIQVNSLAVYKIPGL